MAGQGTVGLEILEQVPDVDAVLVPVGGGGLLAGVATAIKHLKPDVLIYVSQPFTLRRRKVILIKEDGTCLSIFLCT